MAKAPSYLSKQFQSRVAKIYNASFSNSVIGYLAEMPQFSSNASWDNGGAINKFLSVVNNILNFINTVSDESKGSIKSVGILEWQGSSPLMISVPMLFHYDQPFGHSGASLSENVRELSKLTLPSGVGTLQDTLPAFTAGVNSVVDIIPIIEDDTKLNIKNVISGFSAGLRAPADFYVPFASSAGINTLINGGTNLAGKQVGAGLPGLSGLTIIQNRRIILNIPTQWLVTDSITFDSSNQNDSSGQLRWIKATVNMRTFISPPASVFSDWFFPKPSPNATASLSSNAKTQVTN